MTEILVKMALHNITLTPNHITHTSMSHIPSSGEVHSKRRGSDLRQFSACLRVFQYSGLLSLCIKHLQQDDKRLINWKFVYNHKDNIGCAIIDSLNLDKLYRKTLGNTTNTPQKTNKKTKKQKQIENKLDNLISSHNPHVITVV